MDFFLQEVSGQPELHSKTISKKKTKTCVVLSCSENMSEGLVFCDLFKFFGFSSQLPELRLDLPVLLVDTPQEGG